MKANSAQSRAARVRARSKQRGVTATSTVFEAALIMAWFAVLILGEVAVGRAADARRAAENAAETSAVGSGSRYCIPVSANGPNVRVNVSINTNNMPSQIQAALAIVAALGGVSGSRTWGYYIKPLLRVAVGSQASADAVPGAEADPSKRTFEAQRSQGCIERPLDLPKGTMDTYRNIMWVKNLMGY